MVNETNALHNTLGKLFCQYQGQKGTPKQIERVTRQLSIETLRRMLAARGIVVSE